MKEKLKFLLRNKIKIQKNNQVIFNKGNRIRQCNVEIRGVGNKLIFETGANLKGVKIEIEGINCTIKIGKNCVIGEGCYLSAKERDVELVIGEKCMFSRNVKVMTSDGHDIIDINTQERINSAKSIHVGNNVWLADAVVVLKGCYIGDNSILGLNSLITQDIPNNSIAVGIPAKVVKRDIIWWEKLTY